MADEDNKNSLIEIIRFAKKNYIYVEGTKADSFFIIHEGNVKLFGAAQTLTKEEEKLLGPGDFIGHVSSMSDYTHIDSAYAFSDVSLIAVQKRNFIKFINTNTSVARKMILEFSRRMRFLNDALTSGTNKQKSDVFDRQVLFTTAEYYEKNKQYALSYYAYKKYTEYYANGELSEKAKAKIEQYKGFALPDVAQAVSSSRNYKKGNFIFADGEKGDELFVILSGQVKICKIFGTHEMIYAVLKKGDMFGEMAILENKPRSANAIAYEDTSVMVIRKGDFERLSETNPSIIDRLVKILSERIWFSYKQLANTALDDYEARMYDAILINFEKNHENMGAHEISKLKFGPYELAKMCGIPEENARDVINKIAKEKKVQFTENEIISTDNYELAKVVNVYRGVQRRAKARTVTPK